MADLKGRRLLAKTVAASTASLLLLKDVPLVFSQPFPDVGKCPECLTFSNGASIQVKNERQFNGKAIYQQKQLYLIENLDPDIKVLTGNIYTFHLRNINYGAYLLELHGSKIQLEAELDDGITSFCYPYGVFDNQIVLDLANWYEIAVTTQESSYHSTNQLLSLGRISQN